MSIPSIDAWGVHTLRLTAFPSNEAEVNSTNWWKIFTESEPDSHQEKPKIGEIQDAGQFMGHQLTLQVQPSRIDWHLVNQLLSQDDINNKSELLFSPLSEILPPFKERCVNWLKNELPLTRLAFGAILYMPVENLALGYKKISDYLPFEVDGTHCSDFSYSINRWKESSSLTDLKINRLSKWAVSKISYGTITIPFSGVPPLNKPSTNFLACRLELDINTSQDFSSILPQAMKEKIFNELIQLGLEIATQGDRP